MAAYRTIASVPGGRPTGLFIAMNGHSHRYTSAQTALKNLACLLSAGVDALFEEGVRVLGVLTADKLRPRIIDKGSSDASPHKAH